MQFRYVNEMKLEIWKSVAININGAEVGSMK